MGNYLQGLFKPKHPSKYLGDPTRICYRSSWELSVMTMLDSHPEVIGWASEEVAIPYLSPVDGKIHRYFPDLLVRIKRKDEPIDTSLIEIKPLAQTKPPLKTEGKQKSSRYIKEAVTFATNDAKWKAAKKYCTERKWNFILMTEKELGVMQWRK
jgi:Straboviridae/Kyanoviridae head completion nuclease